MENALIRISEEFGAKGKYVIKDVELHVSFSNGNIRESTHKAITDAKTLAKLLPILKEFVNATIGVEFHNNRCFFDTDTLWFCELLGGYVEDGNFVPVRFGVKASKGGACLLYVVVCQEKNRGLGNSV